MIIPINVLFHTIVKHMPQPSVRVPRIPTIIERILRREILIGALFIIFLWVITVTNPRTRAMTPNTIPCLNAFHSGMSAMHMPREKNMTLIVVRIIVMKVVFFILINSYKSTVVVLFCMHYTSAQGEDTTTINSTIVEIKKMNTPNNKRRKETLETIKRAFVELIQNQDLDQISISQLCKKAGINRTTFYACYDGLYDIADSIRKELEDNIRELYKDEIENRHSRSNYLRLFRHITDNQIFYRTYFKLGYDAQLKGFGYDTKAAEEYFDNRFVEYHMEFFRAGITRIIRMWLENGCKESPEDMMEILRSEYKGRLIQKP